MEEKIYNLIKSRGPWFLKKNIFSKVVFNFLSKYLKIKESIFVGDHIQNMSGPEAFRWLGETYTKRCEVDGLGNIPQTGKCLIVSNHPMGPADAVALYHGVSKVRKDAFFFANDLFVYLLGAFDNIMAPVVWDQESQIHKATKKTIERMKTFFFEERIGILFPSGRLSKFTFFGIKERHWQKTPLSIADRHDCLLIPAYIVGRNSWFFYFASVINKQLRDVTQLNELLNKKNKKIKIIIGKPLSRSQLPENDADAIKQLQKLSDSLKR